MKKIEIEAIRALPDEYVKDGTLTCLVGSDEKEMVVAIETNLPPIYYHNGKWSPFEMGTPTDPTPPDVK